MIRVREGLCGFALSLVVLAGCGGNPAATDSRDRAQSLYEQAVTLLEKEDYEAALSQLDRAIEHNPKASDAYASRATIWLRLKDWEKALADAGKLIELDPERPLGYALRGDARLQLGQYDESIVDLKKAIEINSGAKNQPSKKIELSADALRHGNEQVRTMLADRPAMARHVVESDELWQWAARKFAGEDAGVTIDWNAQVPLSRGFFYLPTADSRGMVFVDPAPPDAVSVDDPDRQFEEQWISAVNQLHGIGRAGDFRRVNEDATDGEITREQFVVSYLDIDRGVIDRTRRFFVDVFLPWAAKCGIKQTSALRWYFDADDWHSADPAKREIAYRSDDRWENLLESYDLVRAYGLAGRGDREEAIRIYDTLLADADPAETDRRADLLFSRAYWNFAQGLNDQAIADYSEVIRLRPDHATSYFYRGFAFYAMGDFDKAAADYSEVIRLQPDDVDAYESRGYAWLRLHESEKTIADAETLIELHPDSPTGHALRGQARIQLGQYDEAIAELKQLIEEHPDDVGADYQVASSAKLSPEALQHGDEQVRRMLKDRPAMARHVDESGALWQWAARKFAGEDLGFTIDWNPTPPRFFGAQNQASTAEKRGMIALTRGIDDLPGGTDPDYVFEELWIRAVFELHNVAGTTEFERINEEARSGRITSEQYAAAFLEVEHRAMQRTRAFYVHVFLPWASEREFTASSPVAWFFDTEAWYSPDAAERIIAHRNDERWPLYLTYFDTFQVQHLSESGDYETAFRLIDSLFAETHWAAPRMQADLYYHRAYLHSTRAAYEEADSDYSEAVRLDPDHVDAYTNRAGVYEELGELENAVADYTNALRLMPDNVEVLCSRCTVLVRLQEYELALNDATQAIQLEPESALARSVRGYVWNLQGDLEKAIADYTEALQLDPLHADGYRNRGTAYYYAGEWEKVIADFTEVLRLVPNDVEALCLRAMAFTNQQKLDLARADANHAIELNPKSSLAYRSRGYVRQQAGDYDKAIADYTEALRLDPQNVDVEISRVIVRQMQGEYEQAIAELKDAIQRVPEDPMLHNTLGWIYATCTDAGCRNGQEAIEHARRACELTDFKDPAILDTLAAAYAQAGDFAEAVKWQTQALDAAPEEIKPDLQAHLELFQSGKPWREEIAPNTEK